MIKKIHLLNNMYSLFGINNQARAKIKGLKSRNRALVENIKSSVNNLRPYFVNFFGVAAFCKAG